MKRLFLTGASGFLGWNICREAYSGWDIYGTVFTHPVRIDHITTCQLDLTDIHALKQLFDEIRPDAVIHTAAASSPDYCQKNKSATDKINIDVPVNLAGLSADLDIPYVFTSSDLVFDGLHAPYSEADAVSPVNYYGEQKALAEERILKIYPSAVVCRMPLMFGDPGPAASSFYQTMLKTLREGNELRLFTDEFRTPVSGKTAAQGIFSVLENMRGLIHLGGPERISRYNFGLMIMGVYGITDAALIRCRQKEITTAAARPPDISLDSSKAYAAGFKPLPLIEQLQELLT